jgi:poly(A) polymerase
MSIADAAPWLRDEALQRLLAALSRDGEEARIAGGAVRNALMGEAVADVDIATTTVPEETESRAAAAGFRTVPTGKAHGTITVVADGRPFEVTTLRADVETDGRRARVSFGRDWAGDARRRDFTINALYALADGSVVDLVGGVEDLKARRLRFIGDAEERIREDYLRILRFFRFFAWYGSGRPDAEGLKACARLKDGLSGLSAERVWSEMRRLLEAPDPARALLWMRQSGVLSAVLPETEKWGIDAIHGLVEAERALSWPVDPMLRLEAMVPPDEARMAALARRLRMSRAETDRLARWAMQAPVGARMTRQGLAATLYRGDRQAVEDRLRLALAAARSAGEAADVMALVPLLDAAVSWTSPRFPVTGADLTAAGAQPGSRLGAVLRAIENEWIESGFSLGRDALLERAASLLGLKA